jgi:hypothetical protein
VRTLYGRVRAAHEHSVFADEEHFDVALLAIFKDACRETGVEDPRRAVAIAYTPLSTLLRGEFFSFPDLTDDDFQRMTLRDLSELRTFLFRKDAQLRRADATYDLAFRAAYALLVHVLGAAGEGPATDADGGLELQASALDALHDPAEQIEFAWRLPFTKELEDSGLFEEVRAQLRHNTLCACRIDADDPRAASKVIPPPALYWLSASVLTMTLAPRLRQAPNPVMKAYANP